MTNVIVTITVPALIGILAAQAINLVWCEISKRTFVAVGISFMGGAAAVLILGAMLLGESVPLGPLWSLPVVPGSFAVAYVLTGLVVGK